MKFYIKQGSFPFVYMLFMSTIAFGITAIEGLFWLKLSLAVINASFYLFVLAAGSFKDGQKAMKTLYANDLERMEIIRTGEDRPIKAHEEYKPWKGFVFGLIACVPLAVLLLLHAVIYFAAGNFVGLGAIAGFVYFVFFVFFRLNFSLADLENGMSYNVVWYLYFGALVAVPFIILTTGIFYLLGAKKERLIHERIEDSKRSIYGEQN